MANRLPSGRWRGRVRDPRTGQQVAPHTVIGGAKTYTTMREAERAEDKARDALIDLALRGKTVGEWWTEWTTDPLWARRAESTNLHNAERTKAFAERYWDRALRAIDALVVAEWLKGGRNLGTVPALRAMFNDARKPHAGMLIDANRFAGLGLEQSKGRKHVQPPAPGEVARLIAAADELTPPSFAAYLFAACYSAMRPGELDALMWADLDFTPGAEVIRIERQWNVKAKKITEPKHGSKGTIAMVEPLRDRLLTLPRESEWVFTTLRGHHYVPSTRSHHWNRVRCAVGLGTTALYEATRHYFAWYLLNVADGGMPAHVVAAQLRHDDGGTLVRELYGHPDAAMARERIRAAFRTTAPVVALPVSHEMSHEGLRAAR
jgi:integrase